MLRVFIAAFVVEAALGFYDPHFDSDKYGIVHLFEWHWDTIADECETFLAPQKIGGVQISPPTENRIVDSRPWWERYQPISYMLSTRSGDRDAFSDMVSRCNAVGVRIYADIVINHMCGAGGTGTGTGGTYFDANSEDFPGVPYSRYDFNDDNCNSQNGNIDNYNDVNQVRNCRLVSLLDLNQGTDYVRALYKVAIPGRGHLGINSPNSGMIVDLMNDLISLGVAGFRVDACKHMWPGDLSVIYNDVNNLRSDIFGSNKQPYIYQEVIDQGGSEPIRATDYSGIAPVTEFKYGKDLAANKNTLTYLGTVGQSWGMLPDNQALVFINNHDNQRGHGGGGTIVYFDNPYDLKILTAYMLAYPYGIPRVMSSYYFSNADQGPPSSQRSVNSDGSCGNGWVCEHRWRQIANMFEFAAVVEGTTVENWWSNSAGNFAFSRGDKGFIAANKDGYMQEYLYTGMPDGSYCNVISGYSNGVCTGSCITVSNGYAYIQISSDSNQDQVVAIHEKAINGC